MWLAKPDPFWNSMTALHCDEGKLNIDTSVARFNVLEPLRRLDLYPHPAPQLRLLYIL